MRPFALFASLFGFYVALSGQIHNPVLMGVGLVGCALTTWLASHMGLCDDEGIPVTQWPRTIAYIPWLLYQIALANIDVARRVWNPELPISPCMIDVPHRLRSGYGIATYANSITLTPGTVTVEAPGDAPFVVHALTREAGQDVLAGDMHDRCIWVEGQAFPPRKTSGDEVTRDPAAIEPATDARREDTTPKGGDA